jgi:hypothetical protein
VRSLFGCDGADKLRVLINYSLKVYLRDVTSVQPIDFFKHLTGRNCSEILFDAGSNSFKLNFSFYSFRQHPLKKSLGLKTHLIRLQPILELIPLSYLNWQ